MSLIYLELQSLSLKASEIARLQLREVKVQKFMRAFDGILNRSLNTILDELKQGKLSAKEAAAVLGRLIPELERAGLAKEMAGLKKLYADEFKQIGDYFAKVGYKDVLTTVDKQVAETLFNYDVSSIRARAFAGVDSLKSAVMRQVLVGKYDGINDLITKAGREAAWKVESELRTALSGFEQVITNTKAQELGFDLYIYLGPDDGVTREFCQDVLDENKAWTEEEIAALDNEQGLDPFVYGGGYNCRHQWRPVDKEYAEENGYSIE